MIPASIALARMSCQLFRAVAALWLMNKQGPGPGDCMRTRETATMSGRLRIPSVRKVDFIGRLDNRVGPSEFKESQWPSYIRPTP
jgi:hypothetical protein